MARPRLQFKSHVPVEKTTSQLIHQAIKFDQSAIIPSARVSGCRMEYSPTVIDCQIVWCKSGVGHCIQDRLVLIQTTSSQEEYVLHWNHLCKPENLHCGNLLHNLSILRWWTALSQTLDTACSLKTLQICGRIPDEPPCR